MYCSRRLYKGNAYEICLPIADTGITVVRFYTRGDIILEKEPETTGDSMCFSFTEEDLASLEDGVLRYGYDDFDTNSPYVVVTPGDYSGSTLDDLLEDAYDSGYTAGQEDCSGSSCNIQAVKAYNILSSDTRIFRGKAAEANKFFISQNIAPGPLTAITPDAGYDGIGQVNIGITRIEITSVYNSGVTEGFASGYTSGYTAGQEDCSGGTCEGVWESGYTSGFTDGVESVPAEPLRETITENGNYAYSPLEGYYQYVNLTVNVPQTGYTQEDLDNAYASGYTAGEEDCSGSTTDADLIANLQGDYFVIPEGTERLRDFAFRMTQNYGFSGIVIPNSVRTIGQYAFQGNYLLENITIPSSVETIGGFAFMDCSGLTAMTFDGVTPPRFSANYPLGQYNYTFPIYVPRESVEDYKTALGAHYADRIQAIQ